MRKREEQPGLPATNSGPRPADFPLGSVESRAAVRAMINRRVAPDEKAPTIYRASWVGHPQDEDFEILDLATGLPVPRYTRASRTRSAIVVQQDEVLQDAAAGAAPAQSGKVEVAPHKEGDELLVLDY
jgi:hypothetical protein